MSSLEKRRASNRTWYLKNRVQQIERSRRYRATHREEIVAYRKEYRERNRAKLNAKDREYNRRNSQARRESRLKRAYGLTNEDWNTLFIKQGLRCAVCSGDNPRSKKGWVVDHDHKTGKVRGILCQPCNLDVGHAEKENHAMVMVYLARAS